ncbi:MAG: DUF192 domain-containing protein [Patescibacteria group bacterium]
MKNNIQISPNCKLCNKNYLFLLLILTVIILIVIILTPAAVVSLQKTEQNLWSADFLYYKHQISVNGHVFNVAIADSSNEQSQGLSDRQKLQSDQGMLFVFSDSIIQRFWMKDMLFDLDMIFINNGAIVEIAKNMPAQQSVIWPASYTSRVPADMVLEVPAGTADRLSWKKGDKITIR